jgi:hypothetical protein
MRALCRRDALSLTDVNALARIRLGNHVAAMEDADIELTARYAAYERMLEYLLLKHIVHKEPVEWDAIKSALIGKGPTLSKGLASIEDLERIDAKTTERIEAIFDRASNWAERVKR